MASRGLVRRDAEQPFRERVHRGEMALLVESDHARFLVDCGEGTQVSLRKLNLKWKKITSIFISHTHADHVTGLPGILMLSSQVDRDDPLYIIGPPRIAEYIETSRRVLDMYINYEIVVREVEDQLVMHLQQHLSLKAGLLQRRRDAQHGNLHDVGGGTLDDGVHGLPKRL